MEIEKPRASRIKGGYHDGGWQVTDGTNSGISMWLEEAYEAYKMALEETKAMYPWLYKKQVK